MERSDVRWPKKKEKTDAGNLVLSILQKTRGT